MVLTICDVNVVCRPCRATARLRAVGFWPPSLTPDHSLAMAVGFPQLWSAVSLPVGEAAHSHHCDSCGCRGEFRFVNSHPRVVVYYLIICGGRTTCCLLSQISEICSAAHTLTLCRSVSFLVHARGCTYRARRALLRCSAWAPSLPPPHPCGVDF